MPSYSGVWTLTAQFQAIGSQLWPMGPGAPTSVSATAGDQQATVTFTAPTFTGVPPGITGYLVTSSPGGITATGSASPITVTGLTNGTAYTFTVQATNGVQYGPAGTSGSVTPAITPYGIFAGGRNDAGDRQNIIDYVVISTTGNATDFGDLTVARDDLAGCASATRGVFGGGYTGSNRVNVIDYITIASASNATDFGDLTTATSQLGACNSTTRGLFGGGYTQANATVNTIEYITIASVGNATDFGDLTASRYGVSGCSSSTTGLFGGGYIFSGGNIVYNIIDYVTIASVGNATDFGDLTVAVLNNAACSSSTRGIFAEGQNASFAPISTISYVTIASTGNATSFGDLTSSYSRGAGCSSTVRGVFGVGSNSSSAMTNIMEYITIASTGNAIDFGDLTSTRYGIAACSNTNGGVQ
jgi:hypothetical protein